jgi:hypothetical protein
MPYDPSDRPPAGHHGRRLRHPAVAAVARRLSQAVPGALGQPQPVPAGGHALSNLAAEDIHGGAAAGGRQRGAPLPGAGPAARDAGSSLRPCCSSRWAATPRRPSPWPPCRRWLGRRPGAGGHTGRPDRHRRGRLHATRCRPLRAGRHWRDRHPGHHAPTAPRPATATSAADGAAVAQFVEKPDAATAQRYLAEGTTSGMPACSCCAPRCGCGAGALPPRHRRRHARRLGRRATDAALRAPGKAAFAPCRPSRSTTR